MFSLSCPWHVLRPRTIILFVLSVLVGMLSAVIILASYMYISKSYWISTLWMGGKKLSLPVHHICLLWLFYMVPFSSFISSPIPTHLRTLKKVVSAFYTTLIHGQKKNMHFGGHWLRQISCWIGNFEGDFCHCTGGALKYLLKKITGFGFRRSPITKRTKSR